MNPLRMAIVGAGHLGKIHVRLARQLSNVELVAVCDPCVEAREQAVAGTNTPVYADISEIGAVLDAAILAAPTTLHHALGMRLLEHDVHLLVEKPLAADAAQAGELVEAARRRNLLLQVGHVERFNPALEAAWPYLSDAKYIDARRTSGYPFRSTDIGVVLDLMIHDLDVVLSLVRSPVRHVEALGFSVLGEHEDVAQARVAFQNGCVADFFASRVSYETVRRTNVWTPSDLAVLDFAEGKATTITASDRLAEEAFDEKSLTAEEKAHYKEHFFDEVLVKRDLAAEPTNAIAVEQADFVAAIRAGAPPRVSGEDGRAAVALAEEILDSIRAHPWDGRADGRVGPFATPIPPFVRPPVWAWPADSHPHRREAG